MWGSMIQNLTTEWSAGGFRFTKCSKQDDELHNELVSVLGAFDEISELMNKGLCDKGDQRALPSDRHEDSNECETKRGRSKYRGRQRHKRTKKKALAKYK